MMLSDVCLSVCRVHGASVENSASEVTTVPRYRNSIIIIIIIIIIGDLVLVAGLNECYFTLLLLLLTERPRKTKIGTEVDHVTCDSVTTFKVKRSKVKVVGGGDILWRLPHLTAC